MEREPSSPDRRSKDLNNNTEDKNIDEGVAVAAETTEEITNVRKVLTMPKIKM